jgi:molybdopterin/thiamine biosynthesis adenylyltransferase
MKIYCIGAGGVASYLVPVLKRSVHPALDEIIIMDGDRLEERNLERQLFRSSQIGEYKAQALADMYGCEAINSYLTDNTELQMVGGSWDWLFVMVDNHKARRLALELADHHGFRVLVGANEYTDAQAYYYQHGFRGQGDEDPRMRWPEIETDDSNDPVSCQGVEQEASPQLAIVNMLAAAYMMHLFYFYMEKAAKVSLQYHPLLHTSNFNKIQTETVCQTK